MTSSAASKFDFTKVGPMDNYAEGVRQRTAHFPNDMDTIYTVACHNMEERQD